MEILSVEAAAKAVEEAERLLIYKKKALWKSLESAGYEQIIGGRSTGSGSCWKAFVHPDWAEAFYQELRSLEARGSSKMPELECPPWAVYPV